MSTTESEGLGNIVEELPPKSQNINTITIPPKRVRSEKQIAWSKQLGQKSQEFKKRKQHLLSGQAPRMTQPIPVTAEPEAAKPAEAAESAEPEAVNKSDNKLWLLVPVSVTFGIGLLIVWVKWGKYKVLKMLSTVSSVSDTKPSDTKPANDTGKCKIIAME